ncbi:cytochrome b561 domain-containing protein 2-like [Penaeus monodon]|uniref:cytochrome b561 domain-containing protein 2-like n=1 Tax=Penaeus monodon TaxID=6687 RepID=UPI0018A6F949|nr:cytochrome b561 domain-containing protein 2-like [Penaeus monodon]
MLNPLMRGGGIAFLAYMAVISRPGSSLFSFHPFLMTTAFTGLMTEALLIFSKSGLAAGALHSTRVTVHWILLLLTAVCHSLGFAAIYFNKELNEKPHFTSWHGTVGLVASVFLVLQLSVGVFAMYPKLLKMFMDARSVKANHAVVGTLTFSSGMVATLLGFWSTWFANNSTARVSYGFIGFHAVLLGIIVQKVLKKYVL